MAFCQEQTKKLPCHYPNFFFAHGIQLDFSVLKQKDKDMSRGCVKGVGHSCRICWWACGAWRSMEVIAFSRPQAMRKDRP